MFSQNGDERKVPVALGVIQPIANDKFVRYLEANVISSDWLDSTSFLFKQHTAAQGCRPEFRKFVCDAFQGFSGIKNIIYQEHITAFNVEFQFFREDKRSGSRGAAITRDADKIQPERQLKVADQIREEK